jgi:hypothetical protein
MRYRIVVTAFLILLVKFSLRANVLTVTSLADNGPGSLRDLVAASASGDTIQFAVSGTILLNSAINIPHTLYVYGPGASALVVDANHVDRAFITGGNPVVLSGMTITNGYVVGAKGLDGGNGQNGMAGGSAYGGAILNDSNSDWLDLSNCWITHNTVRGGQGGRGGDNPFGDTFTPGNGGDGGVGEGGALYATGKVFIVNCTFSDNRTIGGDGGAGGTNYNPATGVIGGAGGSGGGGQGGAINLSGTAALHDRQLQNSTLSGNRVGGGLGGKGGDNVNGSGGPGGDGVSGAGGAIATLLADFYCDTIVSNSAFGGIGGLGGNGAPPGPSGNSSSGTAGGVIGYAITCQSYIGNTILADNFSSGHDSNYFIGFIDEGANYIGSDDPMFCAGNNPTTRVGTVPSPLHPQLGPLAQNGGGLPTHATTLTSLVTDAGLSFGLTTDERGAPRPYDFISIPNYMGGDGSDIGAFELGNPDLSLGQGSNSVVISWPAYYGDFTLQSTTNLLLPDNWNSMTDLPALVGNVFAVTNSPVGANRFYRLISR